MSNSKDFKLTLKTEDAKKYVLKYWSKNGFYATAEYASHNG